MYVFIIMKQLLFLLLLPVVSYSQFSFPNFKEQDKQLHFAAGMITGAAGYSFIYNKTNNKKHAILGGIATSLAAGIGKELFDSAIMGNKIDDQDLIATVLGGITINVTIPLFKKRKSKYKQLDKVIGGYKY